MIAPLLLLALAAAQPYDPDRNALSLQPMALTSHGFSAEYERYLPGKALSISGGPELRLPAGGDYQAVSLGAGVEARLWLRGSILRKGSAPVGMVGPYAGVRTELAITRLVDRVDGRSVGTLSNSVTSLGVGWRFAAAGFHLTPSLAFGIEGQSGGGLAPSVRGTVILGLTVGWMF